MKPTMFLIGLLVILAGILPLVSNVMPGIPQSITSGYIYNGIIVLLGIVGLIYGFVSFDLFGFQKFVMVILALLTIFAF